MLLRGARTRAGSGYATILPEFDFETYSEAGYRWDDADQKWRSLEDIAATSRGLKVVGTWNYVQHPSFRLLSLAYNLKDGYGPRHWRPGDDPPWPLFEWIAQYHAEQDPDSIDGLLEAWNSEFEFTVWTFHCVPRLGWPVLQLGQLRCAMSKAAQQGYPRGLDDAGDVLKLTQKKDPEGKRLIQKLTVPKNPTKANPALRWTEDTAPDDFMKFYAYNVQDIMTESEASSKIRDLSPRELEIWKVDQAINQRGMAIDRKAVEDCITIVKQCTEKYSAELREITNGVVQSHSEVQKIVGWLSSEFGVYAPNLDEDTVSDFLSNERALNPAIVRVLKIRQLLSFGSVKKLYAMRSQTAADGRLRGQYAYHAAHTSLWNGQGVQVANLYKGKLDKPEKVEAALACIGSGSLEYVEGVYGDALECVADCLRSMIVAGPGTRLIASDFTAIQAVVTAALAGERWRLEVFRTHGKIYEMCASMITGKPFQFYLDYRKQYNKHHDDRNPYGKIPELSAGFGSWINGWKKFGASEFMDDDQIKAAILKWRASSPMIVELWGGQTRNKFGKDLHGNWANEHPEYYGLEGAAISAVLDPGRAYGYRGIRYQVYEDVLYCQPPGDCDPLVYHHPRLRPSQRPYARPWEYELTYMGWNSNQTKGKGGWVEMYLYSGVLTQNVVAKVSREYQADTLVRCERSRIYLPVMHTHDEVVTEVADGVGSKEEYLKLVNVPREGGYDDIGPWPIKAPSADETHRYGKWE